MKPVVAILSCIAMISLTACQHQVPPSQASAVGRATTISDVPDDLFERLVAIRRDIHQHPELAGNEFRTSEKIATHLRQLGLDVQTGLHGQSVIATLVGTRPGKTIVWRAELDALPGFYPDPEPFRSTTHNVHHACGHDLHIAVALGIAEVLSRHRATLNGRVVFIFQPEEETFKGAKALVDSGTFAAIRADEIYGMHVTAFPVGDIHVRSGEMFAHQRRVRISLGDQLPQKDAEALGKHIAGTLFRARPGAKPWEIQRLVDPAVGVGSPDTAFQDYRFVSGEFAVRVEHGQTQLEADLYETNAAELAHLTTRIEHAVAAMGHQRHLQGVAMVQANPTIHNDFQLTESSVRTLQETFGRDAIKTLFGQAPFFNDDFAYFQRSTPGVYFFVGASNFAKGMVAFNHAPNFHADEDSIRVAVSRFSALLLSRVAAI